MSFSSFDSLFRKTLEAMVRERISELRDSVTAGTCQSHEEYRARCGQIKALNDVLEWSEETQKKILGENS